MRREKIGSFIITKEFYKSDLWKRQCWPAIKRVFRLKSIKKGKLEIEFIGYSRSYPYPKCYGVLPSFTIGWIGQIFFDDWRMRT